jgi:hypothetical protein
MILPALLATVVSVESIRRTREEVGFTAMLRSHRTHGQATTSIDGRVIPLVSMLRISAIHSCVVRRATPF